MFIVLDTIGCFFLILFFLDDKSPFFRSKFTPLQFYSLKILLQFFIINFVLLEHFLSSFHFIHVKAAIKTHLSLHFVHIGHQIYQFLIQLNVSLAEKRIFDFDLCHGFFCRILHFLLKLFSLGHFAAFFADHVDRCDCAFVKSLRWWVQSILEML